MGVDLSIFEAILVTIAITLVISALFVPAIAVIYHINNYYEEQNMPPEDEETGN